MSMYCFKCRRELTTEQEVARGICNECWESKPLSKDLLFEESKDEVVLGSMTIRKGDIIEVTIGRNRTIRGVFKSWSTRLYAMVIEADDREIFIPYKYIKLIERVKEVKQNGAKQCNMH